MVCPNNYWEKRKIKRICSSIISKYGSWIGEWGSVVDALTLFFPFPNLCCCNGFKRIWTRQHHREVVILMQQLGSPPCSSIDLGVEMHSPSVAGHGHCLQDRQRGCRHPIATLGFARCTRRVMPVAPDLFGRVCECHESTTTLRVDMPETGALRFSVVN